MIPLRAAGVCHGGEEEEEGEGNKLEEGRKELEMEKKR